MRSDEACRTGHYVEGHRLLRRLQPSSKCPAIGNGRESLAPQSNTD
jgi:hypothetical protein